MVLASRAEGIFQEEFKDRPRFAIHDYTKAAIHIYVCRHFQSNNCAPLLELCGVLTEKAQGVFIWVKLVVEELIEGYIAGDTISQLRNTIELLPKEITELYQRVLIRRDPKYSSETYVMLRPYWERSHHSLWHSLWRPQTLIYIAVLIQCRWRVWKEDLQAAAAVYWKSLMGVNSVGRKLAMCSSRTRL